MGIGLLGFWKYNIGIDFLYLWICDNKKVVGHSFIPVMVNVPGKMEGFTVDGRANAACEEKASLRPPKTIDAHASCPTPHALLRRRPRTTKRISSITV